jgi:predicted ATPase
MAYGTVGQTIEGFEALAEGVTLVARTGERWWEAELYRLQGELHRHESTRSQERVKALAAAEACFQRSLAVARRQQAKSLELRAAMSLSRLWQCQGKRSQAHELLAPVYGWFTEGFDTADLQEAKALLDELA